MAVLSRAGGAYGGDRHVALMASASGRLLRAFAVQVETMRQERDALALRIRQSQETIERSKELLKRLDEIEKGVNNMKLPLAFADQFYVLREHIRFVRDRLTLA